MEIYNPAQIVPYLTTPDGQKVGLFVLEIGVWNMDDYNTTTVTHNLGALAPYVLWASAMIVDDAETSYRPLDFFLDLADPDLRAGGIVEITSTEVHLRRRTGSVFDSVSYNSEVTNRGYLTLMVKY
jgi:hypothetical protein